MLCPIRGPTSGTGFTTIGVTELGVRAADIHMLDQSHAQLSKARVKPELQDVATITVGDAENLPTNWCAIAESSCRLNCLRTPLAVAA